MVDVGWNGVSLTSVPWPLVRSTADEVVALQLTSPKQAHQKPVSPPVELYPLGRDERNPRKSWQGAARAAGQLSTELRNQGLTASADHFIYKARLITRTRLLRPRGPWRKQSIAKTWRAWRPWLFVLMLEKVAGYGLRPGLIFGWYAGVIALFAVTFSTFGLHEITQRGESLTDSALVATTILEGLVDSVASFHGRGLVENDPNASLFQSAISASEAVIGMIVEAILVATFVQRFFSR
jgi:hypothetical protein